MKSHRVNNIISWRNPPLHCNSTFARLDKESVVFRDLVVVVPLRQRDLAALQHLSQHDHGWSCSHSTLAGFLCGNMVSWALANSGMGKKSCQPPPHVAGSCGQKRSLDLRNVRWKLSQGPDFIQTTQFRKRFIFYIEQGQRRPALRPNRVLVIIIWEAFRAYASIMRHTDKTHSLVLELD